MKTMPAVPSFSHLGVRHWIDLLEDRISEAPLDHSDMIRLRVEHAQAILQWLKNLGQDE